MTKSVRNRTLVCFLLALTCRFCSLPRHGFEPAAQLTEEIRTLDDCLSPHAVQADLCKLAAHYLFCASHSQRSQDSCLCVLPTGAC